MSATTNPDHAFAPVQGKPSAAKSWLKAIEMTAQIETHPVRLLADVIDAWALKTPDRPAILSRRETFSYRDLSQRINQYARWALANDIGVGDTVCLLMPSRPEYLAAWLGITKVGGVVALVNTQLIGRSLAHCMNVAKAKHIIVASELWGAFSDAEPYLDSAPRVWGHGEGCDRRIDVALDGLKGDLLCDSERPPVTINDRALLIYTSGTTGLPKAANVSHRRMLNWGGWFAGLTGATPDDRMYNCLPVYHSVGGVVATASVLVAGGSVVLAEKFSASRFWDDIIEWDCTLFQYIGELCRYLVHAPPSMNERHHRLRMCCGNGLRGDVWELFQERFAIPRILEFYAATEGNFSLYNVEGKPGAIGRIPSFLAHRFPAAIVRFDTDQGLPLRTDDGLCIRCDAGEAGEAIGRIGTADQGGGGFEGYTNKVESEKKILRDVFAKGDMWFRTGDLMMRDDSGFFHFVDRIGDTFRWKGENVAASEVAEIIAACPGVIDASVYGVEIKGHDGRAGMAAIVAGSDFKLAALNRHLNERLPPYARPLFLRMRSALDLTETFKQKKQDLIRDGFDPQSSADALFYRNPADGVYVRLTHDKYQKIGAGEVKL